MKLSPHFSLAELCYSNTAISLGIDNLAKDKAVIKALQTLATNVLEPIRGRFGSFSPNSGYRSIELNSHPSIGGSKTSSHVKGEAVDVSIHGVLPIVLARWCFVHLKDFDQIIVEPTWVHIGYKEKGNRRQTLKATVGANGKMVYSPITL